MPRFPVPSNATLPLSVKCHTFMSRQVPRFYVPSNAIFLCPVKCHAFLSRQQSRQMPRFPVPSIVPSNATLSCRIPRSLWCLARPVCQVTLSSHCVHRENISVSKLDIIINNNNCKKKIKAVKVPKYAMLSCRIPRSLWCLAGVSGHCVKSLDALRKRFRFRNLIFKKSARSSEAKSLNCETRHRHATILPSTGSSSVKNR